jgi:hypothetical protein
MIEFDDLRRDGERHALDYVRWNCWYSEHHRLLYVPTPKAACTSIKWWFADLVGVSREAIHAVESLESDPELAIHDAFQSVAPDNVVNLSLPTLDFALRSQDVFRFAVVRNPYKRIFSAWQSKLLLREPGQSRPYLNCPFFHLPINDATDVSRAFEAFLEHLSAHESPNFLDPHWTPQTELLRPDLVGYSRIANVEALGDLRADLARHLVGSSRPDPFAGPRANESLIPFNSAFISPRSAALLRDLYSADFKIFNYDLSVPPDQGKISARELEVALMGVGLLRGRHVRIAQLIVAPEFMATKITEARKLREALEEQLDAARRSSDNFAAISNELGLRLANKDSAIVELRTANGQLESALNAITRSRLFRAINFVARRRYF